MRKLKIYLLMLFLPIAGYAQQEDVTEVLFVGNSFTFFWNMPQMVEAMAKDQNTPLITRQSTVGGSNLEQHYKGEKGTETNKILENGKFDYVILQDHSSSTIEAPERFEEYSRKMTDLVKNKGAKPLLFMTWGYKSNPLMLEEISNKYSEMGKNLQVKTIPVGQIFTKAIQLRPDLEMYFDDKHPSPNGSYLVALIFYKYLTGNSVGAIPNRLTTKDSEGEKIYLSFVTSENGNFLRQLVEEFQMETLKTSN